MKKQSWLALGAASLCAAVAAGMALAQVSSQAFLKHGFEENEGGWTAFGMGTKVSRTTDAADVKEGKSALAFEYKIEKDTLGALLLPTPGGELTKARAIRFWVKSDYAAPLVVSMQEQNNQGRYLAMFTTPAGKWQQVELSPGDFYLSEDANDPKDPNNKLDLDAIENIGILDVSQMFAQSPEIATLLGIKTGAHKILLDDFSVSAEPLASGAASPDTEYAIEPLKRPQLSWMGLGVNSITLATGAPMPGKSVQVDYRGAPGKAAGFIKRFPRGKLAGMDKISFTCASVKPAKMMIQLEEKGGGKYNVMIDTPGGKMPKEHSVQFSELFEADDSKDSNRKLDLTEVQQIVMMDLMAWYEMTERDNTLWIAGLKASK